MLSSRALISIVFQVFISSHRAVSHHLNNGNNDNFIRETMFGRVQGTSTNLAQVYLGIRFAAPVERWTPPVNPVPWSGILNVTQLKPMCYQRKLCNGPIPVECVREKSEDCLYLNIYAPLGTTLTSRKAVMVYIHGGRFDSGSGGGMVYNAEMLANKGDVIVVTFTYRLGAFGFLVTGSTSDDITGNYGIMDQRQALKWVNENIQYFGGNRYKVTLFGQSVGATCAAIHLTSGKIDKYFHRVIMQSAPFTIPLKTEKVAIKQGVEFGNVANCLNADSSVNASCLRLLPAGTITLIQEEKKVKKFSDSRSRSFLPWIPHINDNEVKSGIIQGLLNVTENFGGKQVIIGTVQEEGLLYIMPAFTKPLHGLALPFVVSSFVQSVGSDLFDLYPISDMSDARDEFSDMTTDFIFACPARLIARELSKRTGVYSYVFKESLSFYRQVFPKKTYCADEPCHGIDIAFVFQSARIPPLVFNAEELSLSDTMIKYWSSFAWFGNVNIGFTMATNWTKYGTEGPTTDTIMGLRSPEVANHIGYRSEVCDKWDIVGYT